MTYCPDPQFPYDEPTAMDVLADFMGIAAAGVITADDALETYIRDRYMRDSYNLSS